MQDSPLFFAGVIALALAETFLSGLWNRFYFTVGIPIFQQQIPIRLAQVPEPEQLQSAVVSRWSAPLVFHRLATGEIAFREKMFGGGLFHYTPVMHGVIRQDGAQPTVVVQGLLNWFVLAFSAFVLVVVGAETRAFTLLFAAFLTLLYFIQRHRFVRVTEAIAKAPC